MSRNNRKNRQGQTPKPRGMGMANKAYVDEMQGLRRSSATSRHRSARDYRRKPKHSGRGWE